MLTVTRASSPPVEEYMALVRQVLESLHFTNQGPMVARLEAELSAQLQSQDAPSLQVLASANGTLALEMALRALGLEGKRIITTPFTYVATLSAILAVGGTPLFVDIDPQTLCITPETVQQHLSEDVSAILPHGWRFGHLPRHCYGFLLTGQSVPEKGSSGFSVGS